MRTRLPLLLPALGAPLFAQALQVPTDIQQPGTQPGEVTTLESASGCLQCHSGYDLAVEPGHGWYGSMMSHAGQDPMFWATVAVAEQDFPGSGDLCLRCHAPEGWMAGRSTPTDGSALLPQDSMGVSCDVCHSMVDPDGSEHFGVQNAPFLAHDEGAPPEAYRGGGMYVLAPTTVKHGPYSNASSNAHGTVQSQFLRRSDACATCHDVSNPAVGDLAPGNGAFQPLPPGTFSGVLGAPVDQKAAFNHFPFAYAPVERTSSEHALSALSTTRVSQYASLPAELQAGAIEWARDAALASTPTGDYVDGTPRVFSCQTCHMPPARGKAAKQGFAPIRDDIARHDLVGGNAWMPSVIEYMDGQGQLVLGGGLDAQQLAGMQAGAQRAVENLQRAASLEVEGDTVRVVNLTGHKLITGFPEGRRMWLRTTWRDAGGTVLRVDGEYGAITAQVGGVPTQVETILDLAATNTRIYQVKPGITQEWAAALVALGYPPSLPLGYDRVTGAVDGTLGELAAAPAGTKRDTFHFVLNNTIVKDTRIPPYGMPYDGALERNTLPVPESQYGDPGPGGVFRHFDEVALSPPAGAATATIDLLYQSTSWEYLQFLSLANAGTDPRLGSAGDDLLAAWLATGMAAPVLMASEDWAAGGVGVEFCHCASGPCANPDREAGCANSTGEGARLSGAGSASASADDLVLVAEDMPPGKSALLFAGTIRVNGGVGLPFGDGLRCAGGAIQRLGIRSTGALGTASWGPGLSVQGGWGAGDLRTFQVWYRDGAHGSCSSGFNLTQGLEVTFRS
jgi:hypothetical protein